MKRGYKTNARAGSLCELKPTSAAGTFQSSCGPFGINVRPVGNHVLTECEYEHTVCMKPISGAPHLASTRRHIARRRLVLLNSLLASLAVIPVTYSTWRHRSGAGWCSVASSLPSSSELVHEECMVGATPHPLQNRRRRRQGPNLQSGGDSEAVTSATSIWVAL